MVVVGGWKNVISVKWWLLAAFRTQHYGKKKKRKTKKSVTDIGGEKNLISEKRWLLTAAFCSMQKNRKPRE